MKKTLALILTFCMILALTACGGSSSGGSSSDGSSSGGSAGGDTGSSSGADTGSGNAGSGDEYTPIEIILDHGCTETTAEHASFQLFEEKVEESSGDAVSMNIYPNKQHGGNREYTEGTVTRNVN